MGDQPQPPTPFTALIEVEINNRQSAHAIDEALLQRAVVTVLEGESVSSATISLAIVDDATIHQLNRRYLEHDYATDVLSFVLDWDGRHLDGEVIVSADTAARTCGDFAASFDEELTLYVVHGVLHLTGADDGDRSQRRQMRSQESRYLGQLGFLLGGDRAADDVPRSGVEQDRPGGRA